ncbi:hypothetical protein [Tepidiforma sp.]|uniref:hypothetical protein n=1 Tax=Tepidiforma sp. TaxID=2682230 RepID=UPI002ADD8614|nr:hypothetical protein [Tepidiforma sp.]
MPDRGQRTLAKYVTAGAPGGSCRIERSRLLQVTFEVDRDAALALMPEDVTRPIPCYARLLVVEDLGHEGAGFAVLGLGGRFRMLPRNVFVVGVAAAPGSAADGLPGPWLSGSAAIRRGEGEVTAEVEVEGRTVASVRLPAPFAIDPGMLRWDAWVVGVSDQRRPALAESPFEVRAEQTWLSRGFSVEAVQGLDRASPFRRLRPLLPVSACVVEGAVTFGPVAVPAPLAIG